jgi:anti-sigma factor RsiW
MTCQEAIDLIGDAIDGRLPPSAAAGFQEHMTECSSCGTYFGQIRLTRQALGSAPRPAVSSPHKGELISRFREEFRAGK